VGSRSRSSRPERPYKVPHKARKEGRPPKLYQRPRDSEDSDPTCPTRFCKDTPQFAPSQSVVPALPPDRPRFVSAAGWTGVILGAVVALKSLVEIAVWKIVEPAMPALLGAAPRPGAEVPFARMIYAHLTAIKLAEAAFWAFAAIASGALLLLRP
jgi:hypothetical protein